MIAVLLILLSTTITANWMKNPLDGFYLNDQSNFVTEFEQNQDFVQVEFISDTSFPKFVDLFVVPSLLPQLESFETISHMHLNPKPTSKLKKFLFNDMYKEEAVTDMARLWKTSAARSNTTRLGKIRHWFKNKIGSLFRGFLSKRRRWCPC